LTPLHLAAKLGDVDCVKLLLDKNANANAKDAFSSTPLHATKSAEVAKLLIENNAGKIFHSLVNALKSFYSLKLYLHEQNLCPKYDQRPRVLIIFSFTLPETACESSATTKVKKKTWGQLKVL
jgi:hypothetical protein